MVRQDLHLNRRIKIYIYTYKHFFHDMVKIVLVKLAHACTLKKLIIGIKKYNPQVFQYYKVYRSRNLGV